MGFSPKIPFVRHGPQLLALIWGLSSLLGGNLPAATIASGGPFPCTPISPYVNDIRFSNFTTSATGTGHAPSAADIDVTCVGGNIMFKRIIADPSSPVWTLPGLGTIDVSFDFIVVTEPDFPSGLSPRLASDTLGLDIWGVNDESSIRITEFISAIGALGVGAPGGPITDPMDFSPPVKSLTVHADIFMERHGTANATTPFLDKFHNEFEGVIVPVPEPGTIGLSFLGLLGVFAVRRASSM